MANADAPFGLAPVRYFSGAPYNGAANLYYAADDYNTNLFIGDPVVISGESDTEGTPEIVKATAGATNRISGVIVGFEPTSQGSPTYGPANTLRKVYVADDPNLLFAIQADGTFSAADIGLNANVIYTNAGDTTTGLSGVELNTATDASDATFQLQSMRLLNNGSNEFGAYAKVLVRINLHSFAAAVAGV